MEDRGATVREERDDGGTRAGRRVEEWGNAGLEALLRSDDVMEVQSDGMGRVSPLEAMVDSVLQDEAMRFEALSSLGGFWDSGNSSLFSLDRTPEGEFFDHSRVVREVCQNGRESQRQGAAGSRASGSACWDMVEFKGSLATVREQEGVPFHV
ncbi:hypothetical protein AAG906_011824 [Vitis piasezkii]